MKQLLMVLMAHVVLQMQKVERSLLSTGSRASSVNGDSFIDDSFKTKVCTALALLAIVHSSTAVSSF